MEPYQVDVLASAMLRDLEQINDPEKSRLTSQSWSDVGKLNRLDRVHLNRTFLDAISTAYRYVRMHPDTDRTGDPPESNSLAKPFSKYHG